jgi:hypothetical protein
MYYDAKVASSGTYCISVATSASVTGPFADHSSGPLVCQTTIGGSIDPEPFVDPATGDAYLIWKNNDGSSTAASQVWSEPIGADGTTLPGSPNVIFTIHSANYPWQTTTDDPSMAYAGGAYYLFFSGGDYLSNYYPTGYVVCAGPNGGCDLNEASDPILSGTGGTGGGMVFNDASGGWWLAYQTWKPVGCTSYTGSCERQMFIAPITLPRLPLPAITTSALPEGGLETPYSYDLAATSGTGAYQWAVTAGVLPSGLTLNAATGAITGTPMYDTTAAGTPVTYSATVTSIGTPDVPTGTVTFAVNSTTLCVTPALVGGAGSCTATTAPAQTDTVTAAYSGDILFAPSVGTTTLVIPAGPYNPLAPVRICDTRSGNPSGLSGVATQCNGIFDSGTTLPAGTTTTIAVAGEFGIPSGTTSVVLDVTAVAHAAPGYLTIFPAGGAVPLASNVNYVAFGVVPNLVDVGTGSGGKISIYSSAQADVVVDAEGYSSTTPDGEFTAGSYYPLPSPARLCDTRAGNPSQLTGGDAQCDGGASDPGERLGMGGTLTVQVSGNNGVPVGAVAAVLNVTSVTPAGAGYLTVYPEGTSQPFTSNVNYTSGQTSANRVIVPLSSSGQISIYSSAASNVVVDLSGYYADSLPPGTNFSALSTPVRICDTRPNNPSDLSGGAAQCDGTANAGDTLGSGATISIQVTGLAGVPASANAVVLNVTGVAPSVPTYLTVFPADPVPFVSDLNLVTGQVRANLVFATLSPTGTISIYNDTGTINVVVDVLGWYS